MSNSSIYYIRITMQPQIQKSLDMSGIILFILIIPLIWLSGNIVEATDKNDDPEPVTSSEVASEESFQAAVSFSNTSKSSSSNLELAQFTATTTLYIPFVSTPAEFMNDAEMAVLNLVNAERANVGCLPVTGEQHLHQAAILHSKDMADNNYFSHTGLNGSRFSTRASAAGYVGFPAGENIAAGYRTAESVMAGWMSSSGHRQNILNCNHTHLGIGHYYNSNSTYRQYWTQVFGQE